MRGAIQIAKFFDIPVRLHWSFFLLFVYVAYMSQRQGDTWNDTGWSFLFMLAIFGCVVLHEFGHALMARRYGVDTKDIILSPIGGIARLYRLPELPGQELMVAIAGPMVNILIAAILGPFSWWTAPDELGQLFRLFTGGTLAPGTESASFLPYFIPALFLLNITLAVFNLLPAFPMDGGRVLRALLSFRFSRLIATRIASRIGQVMSLLLAGYGLQEGNIVTALIGAFIFFMASQEYRQAKMDDTLRAGKVEDIREPLFTRLYLTDPITHVLEIAQTGQEKHFLVFQEDGAWAGVMHGAKLGNIAKDPALRQSIVLDHYTPVWTGLTPHDSLKTAFERMYQAGTPILPVFQGWKLWERSPWKPSKRC
ncbi:MAG: site-2 protease family protein [Saprospirales bacterium]|nr:site-2 protease family protein [Saprospirales bacterium]